MASPMKPPHASLTRDPRVQLVDVRDDPARREWLTNVYPFYLHDLTRYAPDAYRLSPAGRWEPDHLPYWLSHPFCHPLVALHGAEPIGFAFVGEAPFPYMSPGIRFRISELFVLGAHRRSGLGRDLARAVLSRLAGPCELTVLAHNDPALAFWRAVLPLAIAGPIQERADGGEIAFTFVIERAVTDAGDRA